MSVAGANGGSKERRRMEWLTKTLALACLVVLAVMMGLPFFWMVSASLMGEFEAYEFPPRFWPAEPQWNNYSQALTALPFGRFFLNTLIMTLGTVGGQLLICSAAAYAFARMRFPGRRPLFALYLSTMMVPAIVTLIPMFLIIQSLGWMNTYWALIVPFASSVWGIFLLRQFFLTLPSELEDAARLDGASNLTIWWRVILPLSRPALATLGLFSLISTWQQFLWPLVVTNRMDMRPVEVGVAMFQSIYQQNLPHQMAAAVCVTVPLALVFLIAQRYFVRGIALTGLKG